jgi:hypothetical protein
MFHMANDSGLFLFHEDVAPHIVAREGASAILDDGRRVYPLYEGKMLWQYDHRYGTYQGQTQKQANKGVLPHVDDTHHDDPDYRVQPRYWVEAEHVDASGWWADRAWSLAFRDVGIAERSFIPTIVSGVAAGHKSPLLASNSPSARGAALVAVLSSLVVDYDARQSGLGMAFNVVEQLAAPTPENLSADRPWLASPVDWLAKRTGELAFTNVELGGFAEDCDDAGPPFRWIPERRAEIQAEIDAAVLHLYRLDRSQAEWLIDSFTVLRKYEERDHGEFRTKRLVLGYYDLMQTAIDAGIPYASPIDPPPGYGPRHPHHQEQT